MSAMTKWIVGLLAIISGLWIFGMLRSGLNLTEVALTLIPIVGLGLVLFLLLRPSTRSQSS